MRGQRFCFRAVRDGRSMRRRSPCRNAPARRRGQFRRPHLPECRYPRRRAMRGGLLKRSHGRVQFGVFFKLLGDGQRGAEFVQPVPVIRAAVEHGLQLLRAPGGSAQIAVLRAGLVHAVVRPDGAGVSAGIRLLSGGGRGTEAAGAGVIVRGASVSAAHPHSSRQASSAPGVSRRLSIRPPPVPRRRDRAAHKRFPRTGRTLQPPARNRPPAATLPRG